MKITSKIKSLIGLDDARTAAPPRYHTITDGLLVTATKAEAWFDIATSNTDTATNDEKIDSLSSVMTAVSKALGEHPCHLKLLWGRHDGAAYLDSVDGLYDGGLGDGEAWAEAWADRIDALGLPERHVMLGVTIDLRGTASKARASEAVGSVFGTDRAALSDRELADYQISARRVLRTLGASPLRARQASAEKIAWMLTRETGRVKQAVPRDGTIKGAALQHLIGSRVLPYSDHLELTAEDGTVALYSAVLPIIDFPEEIVFPGEAEWLRTLSTITKLGEYEREDGLTDFDDVPVFADASIRFQGMPRRAALKAANEARRTAKEQRRSASQHSAGEIAVEVEEAEVENEHLANQIKRMGTSLVNHHPRLIATGATREELDDNVQAIIDHFADLGITVVRGADEQRDLWLEALPGDVLRVTDLGHIQTDVAFWGSFFWAGSRVGDGTGGTTGFTTGTTASLYRSNVLGGGERGDATTTFYGGRSGRGKSTALGLELISALLEGPRESWAAVIDGKGDLGGLVTVAQRYDIPSALIEVTARHSGAADMFRCVEPSAAPAAVQRQMTLIAQDAAHVAIAASASLRYATIERDESETPSTFGVIERMRHDDDPKIASFGQYLHDLSSDPLGCIVLGPQTGEPFLRDDPGLWLLQVPNLKLPQPHLAQNEWDAYNRLSLALLQGITTYSMSISSSKRLRQMRKGVAVPEVHLFLAARSGASFLDEVARMGRAFNTSLVMDSQDCEGVAALPGLAEQLQGVRIFQLTSQAQQDAAAVLLGLEPGPATRELIHSLARSSDDETIRKGHAVVRDWRERVATVQFDFPSVQVAEDMSTDPTATANLAPTADPADAGEAVITAPAYEEALA